MESSTHTRDVRLALPTGRMQAEVLRLLADAGVQVKLPQRDYRPGLSLRGFGAKILKPRNVVGMLAAGARDVGFAGADWVAEMQTNLVELLDTGLDVVRLAAAAPTTILVNGKLPERPLVVASEYASLTKAWIDRRGLTAIVLTTYGATEVFPPEDADCVVDIVATGATLGANGLEIIDELLTSSTRLYANPASIDDPVVGDRIRNFVVLLRSALEARRRVMLDLNVSMKNMARVIECLPCMREPTISHLRDEGWCAVRAAVLRSQLAQMIPALKACGARDIVATTPSQIIP